jgi:hypothetical protein
MYGPRHEFAQLFWSLETRPEAAGLPRSHLCDEPLLLLFTLHALLHEHQDLFFASGLFVLLMCGRDPRRPLGDAIARAKDEYEEFCRSNSLQTSDLRRCRKSSKIFGHHRFMPKRRQGRPCCGALGLESTDERANKDFHWTLSFCSVKVFPARPVVWC